MTSSLEPIDAFLQLLSTRDILGELNGKPLILRAMSVGELPVPVADLVLANDGSDGSDGKKDGKDNSKDGKDKDGKETKEAKDGKDGSDGKEA